MDIKPLMDRIAVGDKEAFSGIYTGYSGVVYHTALAECGDVAMAIEIQAAVFAQIYERLCRQPYEGDFALWVVAVTLRECRSRINSAAAPAAAGFEASACSDEVAADDALRQSAGETYRVSTPAVPVQNERGEAYRVSIPAVPVEGERGETYRVSTPAPPARPRYEPAAVTAKPDTDVPRTDVPRTEVPRTDVRAAKKAPVFAFDEPEPVEAAQAPAEPVADIFADDDEAANVRTAASRRPGARQRHPRVSYNPDEVAPIQASESYHAKRRASFKPSIETSAPAEDDEFINYDDDDALDDIDDEIEPFPVLPVVILSVVALALLWVLVGLLMRIGFMPRVDLGYSWFNTALFEMF